MIGIGALRHDEEDGRLLGQPEQALEQEQRGRVDPVDVLDGDDHRPLGGEQLQELLDDLERPVLERLRRELGEPRAGVGLERQTEDAPEVGIQLARALARQTIDGAPEEQPRAQLRIVHGQAQPVAQQLAKRPVRHRLAVRDAAPFQPQRRPFPRGRIGDPAQLREQPALADPGLAPDQQDAARSARHELDRRPGPRDLCRPPDEQRVVVRPRRSDRAEHLVRQDGIGLAFQLQAARLAEAEQPLHQPDGLGAREHRSRWRLPLQTGSDVHGVADGAVLDATAGAHGADDHGAGVDADAGTEARDAEALLDLARVGSQLVGELKRRAKRALGVVFVGGRRTEQGEHPVAREVLHRPAEPLDGVHHPRDRVADQEADLLGVEPLAERRRSDEVGGERGDHPPLFTHCGLRAHHGVVSHRVANAAPNAGRAAGASRWIALIALAQFALLTATSTRYGFHRDELYFIVAGSHPAFGYPDQPPLVPLLAWAMHALGPGSLFLLRLPSARRGCEHDRPGRAGGTRGRRLGARAGDRRGLHGLVGVRARRRSLRHDHHVRPAEHDRARLAGDPRDRPRERAGDARSGDRGRDRFEAKPQVGLVAVVVVAALLVVGPRWPLRSWWTAGGVAAAVVLAAPVRRSGSSGTAGRS